TSPLPNSPYNVGPDGRLKTADDSGYTWVRVRVIDQSGNVTNLPSDPVSAFVANGAFAKAVIDTTSPYIIGISPTPGNQIAPAANGRITFSFTTNENFDPSKVNTNSIQVV